MKSIEPEHHCNAKFTDAREKDFPIIWLRADTFDQLGLLRRSAKKVWLGVCGFSHRIFRVAYYGALDLIIFQDLVISGGKCEEAQRCLVRQCPLNRTSGSTVKMLLRGRKGEKLEFTALTSPRHCALFKERPNQGGIMVPPS
jgi:hypothetical protein